MDYRDAIEAAAEAAYNEDADMVLGIINDDFVWAHNEDAGRIAQMTGQTIIVKSDGPEIEPDWVCEECDCQYKKIGNRTICNTGSGDGWFEVEGIDVFGCDC